MTRQEHLKFCKVCKNQKFDTQNGIICSLTDKIADFENNCENFEKDEKEESYQKQQEQFYGYLSDFEMASQGKRIANYILDRIFFFILIFLFSFTIGIIIGLFFPQLIYKLQSSGKIIDYIVGFFITFIYFLTFESITGRTIAKYITKTKVVDLTGKRPTFGAILTRTFCRFIPFEAFSFLSSDNTGWHDRFSDTRVVEVKKEKFQF